MSPVPLVSVAIVLAAIPPAVLARQVWRDLEEPGAKPFAANLIVIVVFDLVYALSTVVGDPGVHRFLFVVLSGLVFLTAIVWLVFALEYTGRVRFVTRRTLTALAVLPAIGFFAYVTPGLSRLMLVEYDVTRTAGVYVASFAYGPLGRLFIGVGFLAMLVGLVVLLRFLVSERNRYGLQASVLSLVVGLHHVAITDRIFEFSSIYPVNLSPLAWAVGSVIALYALEKWDLFGFAPAVLRVGQAAAFDDLGDAFVIVDEEGRIVDANSLATDLLGRPVAELVQEPVDAVFETEGIDLAAGSQTARLWTASGHRDFDVSVSAIDGSWGETIGYTLVLHDVTVEKQRRQRFEVLNRILRHNLRNSMNAVVGYARELEEGVDGSQEWMLERIEDQSTHLVALSEKARDIDRVSTPETDPRSLHVATVLERVREGLAEAHDGLTVTVDAPDDLAVTTNEGVLEEVVQYAAHSLLQYNVADGPRVQLSATRVDGDHQGVACTISSNGDPIPDDERRVIERGEETPLDHSHDLDLWLVSWGIDTLGGDLRFVVDDEWPGLSLSVPEVRSDSAGDGDRASDGTVAGGGEVRRDDAPGGDGEDGGDVDAGTGDGEDGGDVDAGSDDKADDGLDAGSSTA